MKKHLLIISMMLGIFFSIPSVYALKEASVEKITIPIDQSPISSVVLGTYGFEYNTFPADLYEFFDENGYYNVVYEIYNNTSELGWVTYNISTKKVIRNITIPRRLTKFGNAIYKNNYLYVMYGADDNSTYDTSKSNFGSTITLQMVKYDTSGNVIKELPISGLETSNIDSSNTGEIQKKYGTRNTFKTGNCDMAINSGGVIKVILNREMYNGHTSSVELYIDSSNLNHLNKRSTMNSNNKYYYVDNKYYASHSFEERVIADSDDEFVTVDLTDANPRGMYLTKTYSQSNGLSNLSTYTPFHFREGNDTTQGYNDTFASLGNIIDVGDGYILVGSSEKTLSLNYAPTLNFNESRNLFIQKFTRDLKDKTASSIAMLNTTVRTSETSRTSTKNLGTFYLGNGQVKDYGVKWLTNYNDDYTTSEVRALKIDNNRVMIIWQEREVYVAAYSGDLRSRNNKYYLMIIDSNGNIVKEKTSIPTATPTNLIDYVYKDGYVYWSETSRNSNSIVLNKLNYNSTSDEAYISIVGSDNITIGVPTQLNVKTNKNINVIWSSTNTKVATVDSNGLVTPVANGTATITASLDGYGETYKVNFSVTVDLKVSEIKVNTTSYDLVPGGTQMIYFTVLPYAAANRTINWSVSDPSIFEITETGNSYLKIKALSYGKATLTGNSTDGGNTKVNITINVYKNLESVSIKPSTIQVERGKTTYVSYTVTPSDSTEPVSFNSTNTSIATIDDSGKITGIKTGRVMMDAFDSRGNHKARFTVDVVVLLTDIKLNKNSVLLSKGDTFTLEVTPDPVDTTDSLRTTFTSDNTSVATVSSSGLITAKSNGTATITVTTSTGLIKKCKVTVGEYQRGDFSKNGEVKLDDAIIGLRKVFGYISSDDNDLAVGDLNNNGKLDLSDIIILLRYIFGYIKNI